jgi:hypothetical protein
LRSSSNFPDRPPVLELYAELECDLGLAHEVPLVDAQQLVESAQQRDGGLAHAHRADLIRLDQADVEVLAHQLAQCSSSHPAGGPAADDHHSTYLSFFHVQARLCTNGSGS